MKGRFQPLQNLRHHEKQVRNLRAALLSRAGYKQREIVDELGLDKSTVSKLLNSSDVARNSTPDLLDEAAAPYGDDILAVAGTSSGR